MKPVPERMLPAEVVDFLIDYWDLKNQVALADELGVGDRSVSQYKGRATDDIQTKIIVALLRDLGYVEGKLDELKQQLAAAA